MNDEGAQLSELQILSKRMAKRALDVGENRLQLLILEVEEERDRLLQALLLGLGAAALGLLAGVAFTLVVLLLFWNQSPLLAMVVLTAIYGAATIYLMMRLARLRRDWNAFSDTVSQLRKDISCLAQALQ
jgi:uncharacterized membrane protein YqjE